MINEYLLFSIYSYKIFKPEINLTIGDNNPLPHDDHILQEKEYGY